MPCPKILEAGARKKLSRVKNLARKKSNFVGSAAALGVYLEIQLMTTHAPFNSEINYYWP